MISYVREKYTSGNPDCTLVLVKNCGYFSHIEKPLEFRNILDVRDLFDDDSNSLKDYKEKIDLAWDMIQKHGKVVVCCVAGISRSNAIALGVLVKYFNMDFYEAWEFVKSKVPIANIDPAHIEKLKKLFNVTLP